MKSAHLFWRVTFARGLRSTVCLLLLGTALLAGAWLSFPNVASAVTMETFNFSGDPILGGDNPSFLPDVTAQFTFDDTCMTGSCSLTIALTYNDSGGLSTIGETLTGVSFDAFSNGSPIDLVVSLSSSTMSATSLVGAGSADALSDFGAASNSNVDVSGHWGFVSGFVSSDSLGSNVLSSVGDAFPDKDVVSQADIFSGTISSVELQPPNGTSFSIVDDNTCTGAPGTPSCSGLKGGFQDKSNRVWIQNEATVTLIYDGSTNKLTSVGNVDPLFGTEGRPLDAPGIVIFQIAYDGQDGKRDARTVVVIPGPGVHGIDYFETAAQQLNIQFEATFFPDPALGYFVHCIDGVCAENSFEWRLYYNNAGSGVGISSLNPVDGDVISWRYEEALF